MPEPQHPTQPMVVNTDGTVRFKRNHLVRHLLDYGGLTLTDMNREVQAGRATMEDYRQLMQLIGYSVSGYGDIASSMEDEPWLTEAVMFDEQAAELYRTWRDRQINGRWPDPEPPEDIGSPGMNPSRWPTLNESVHYVSFGTPGGEYSSKCRAADVTEVLSASRVSLFVKNPTGIFLDQNKAHAAPDPLTGGTWHYESECIGGSRPTMAP